MDLRISPLNIKIVLESNPLKSRILVRRLAVWESVGCEMRTGGSCYRSVCWNIRDRTSLRVASRLPLWSAVASRWLIGISLVAVFGRGEDTVGNPHRAQICQFELFELLLLLKSDKQFPVEQFEATVSQSTVPSPPLMSAVWRSSLPGCLDGLAHSIGQQVETARTGVRIAVNLSFHPRSEQSASQTFRE